MSGRLVHDSRITVVGTGYIGLPLAIMLARNGYTVSGCDVSEEVVRGINAGLLKQAEADLAEIFKEPEVRENLTADCRPRAADIFVISVPTPLDHRKRVADLSYVTAAIESIVPFLEPDNLVIVESTIPPLTCRNVITPILESSGYRVGERIHLAHCPERILPGNIVKEIIENDRVIGAQDPVARRRAKTMYASFVKGKLFLTDDVSAELVKLMENTYRDVNVALANEFAAVAEGLGIDVVEAIGLANHHPRVNILSPGIGTGGHCIPIDPWFIKEIDPVNTRLINTARDINMAVPSRMAAKIRRAVSKIAEPRIVAVGLTYKPNTYDTRESPAAEIVQLLRQDGYHVDAYDPFVANQNTSLERLVQGADCLVILVEHDLIKQQLQREAEQMASVMRNPNVLRFYPTANEPKLEHLVAVA
jgi:UDP-N-acetyl-D-mannosaminuronic acid dehydrogenase